ncbi:MAG: cytochrome c peroxidase [Pseudomonadota bacterium]
MKISWFGAGLATLLIVVGSTASAEGPKDRAALFADYRRPAEIPFPADNPFTVEKAELGHTLFFDPRLSKSNVISCATCHNPGLGWGDGLAKGIGHGATNLGRRSPTILNLAWAELLMWDGRKNSLEDQALGPIEAEVEMAQNVDELIVELGAIPDYRIRFNSAFPGEGLTKATLAKAIATYERTVVSGLAPFDRWIAGDEAAIPESAKRGFDLFNGKANCAACHSGWSFTDHGFHDIGLPDTDIGRGAILKLPSMRHAFKTPTLRDIARRAPYMHDGSVATLEAAVRHYDTGFVRRPSLSPSIKPLGLSDRDVADLVAFMETLTSPPAPVILPVLPIGKH